MYDTNGISCYECTKHKRRQGLEPDCKNCDRVKLLPENEIVDYIMYWYGATFVDGMGGISLTSINKALVLENIVDKQLIAKKVIVYLKAGLDVQNEEISDGGQNPNIKT